MKVKHLLAQAPKVKTYHCSYQVFISLQHPHLLEAQCPPWLERDKPWVQGFARAGDPVPEMQKQCWLQQRARELGTAALGAEGTAATGW